MDSSHVFKDDDSQMSFFYSRQEMFQHGVTVHAVSPGHYVTDITDIRNQRLSLSNIFYNASPYNYFIYGDDFIERSEFTLKIDN